MVTPTTFFTQKTVTQVTILLFREAEGYNPVSTSRLTIQNLVCGFYKKLRHVRHSGNTRGQGIW